MSDEERYVVDERALYEVYSLLADATQAAATVDSNACASLASDAKEAVKDLHREGQLLEEVADELNRRGGGGR